MSWTLLAVVVSTLGFALAAAVARRAELRRMRGTLAERERSVRQGSSGAQLLHPVVDLSRCLGCGTCVKVCPEEGVLDLVHGQAMVVNAARCVGHAACEKECPVGAITVTVANLKDRRDIPALQPNLEAVGAPGLFLAGEVTAHALIKTAIEQGTGVAGEVARRVEAEQRGSGGSEVLDLCIVGAGPAGLACSLEAKRLGLSFATLDQEHSVGGTVAKYPRRKLVLTQPVDLPLHGRLARTSYTKEELIDLWREIARRHELPLKGGEVFQGVERHADGHFVVRTETGAYAARHVCLALGRRGVPRRLGVPGEDLPKVAYSLLDARSYAGRRILVVGGGESAVEAAVGLAEQPDTEVTLSYRKEEFFRVRRRERLDAATREGRLRVLFRSEVREIGPDSVALEVRNGHGPERVTLPNDEVFVMAGGVAPVEVLERSGVSLDPALRPEPAAVEEQGTGLVRALAAGFVLSLLALVWALVHLDYYGLSAPERPVHAKHPMLRPGMGIGLGLGIAAAGLIVLNLLYLLRRSTRFPLKFGSLKAWMTSHVATGILALLCALLHAAMAPGDTPGGHAFWALVVLGITGAIGRYLYAWVPRAANGRELELEEAKGRLQAATWGKERIEEVTALIEKRQWRGTFVGRLVALFAGQRDLRRALARMAREGRRKGVPEEEIAGTMALTRQAHRAALMAAHFEDLRAVLGTWRFLHRWVALLMVLLVVLHVLQALLYGGILA